MTRALFLVCAMLLVSAPAAAQDALPATGGWSQPLEGIAKMLFGGENALGVLLVTPSNDPASQEVEQLIREELLRSEFVELVMDDSPLGDMSGKSDDEIIAAARKYPVDVVMLLRTFPGTDGPTAVLRIETSEAAEAQSYRFRPGADPPWARRPPPTPVPSEDPQVIAASRAADFARQEAAMTKMGAVGIAETLRLMRAEDSRRELSYEAHSRSPVVRNPAGEVVPWPTAYETMDRADLALRYRRRRVTRTAAMATGGILAAAGIGMLFVGLVNQADCGGAAGCGRPILLIGGFSSLGLGAISVATGLMLRRHPIPTADVEALVSEHNQAIAP